MGNLFGRNVKAVGRLAATNVKAVGRLTPAPVRAVGRLAVKSVGRLPAPSAGIMHGASAAQPAPYVAVPEVVVAASPTPLPLPIPAYRPAAQATQAVVSYPTLAPQVESAPAPLELAPAAELAAPRRQGDDFQRDTVGASVTAPNWALIAAGALAVGGFGWFLHKRGIF